MSAHQQATVSPSVRHLVEVRWTAACYERLRAAWANPEIPAEDLPRVVGRTDQALRRMARLLNLGPRPAPRAKKGHEWTDEQVAALRRLWPDVVAVAVATGRTESACEKKAYTLKMPPRTGFRLPLADVERTTKEADRLKVREEASQHVARNCLCCGRAFAAPTRFIRLCNTCKGGRD